LSDVTPIPNDQWFEVHCAPKLAGLVQSPTGYYDISIGLCYRRHDFKTEEGDKIDFSIFPRWVEVPNLWKPNYPHVIRFLRALQEKINTFTHSGEPIINIRLYLSGANGPMKAFEYAYYCPLVDGFDYWALPESWKLTMMNHNSETQLYDAEPPLWDYASSWLR
jgi:hypothetical protein